MAARTEAERGDIISEYPLLVLSFVAVQISGWIVGLLELFGVLGSVVGYELMDSLTPLDLAFCQAMFWGTLHHGPIDYGRLALICRVGFVIDGFIFMYSSATKFLPTGLETPVEVMRILNASSVAELFAELPAWPLFLHALQVAFWFFIFIPFSAWIGTTTLAVGRLRLLQRVPSAALPRFSTGFLRVYALVIFAELLLVASTVVRTASATTDEELMCPPADTV